MAEPKLQIERRVDRIERAVRTLAIKLGPEYSREIQNILDGKNEGEKVEEVTDAGT